MLLVVEGPDCSRKSTLCRRVAAQLTGGSWLAPVRSVDVLHAKAPVHHPLDEYELPLLDYRPGTGRHVICDRWHLGEAVYPAVLDRPTRWNDAVFRHIELFLESRGALLVVVTPELAELRRCLTTRGDDRGELDQVEAVREGFVRVATRTGLPLVWLKDEAIDDQLVRYLVDVACQRELHAAALTATTALTYVGPRWPSVLLLGDVRKTGTDPLDLRPAFMPYPATSGHYLLETLGDRVATSVGLANACDVDDPVALYQLLGAPRVVALGRNAQRAVNDVATSAPHPQFWRRFHHHDRAEYRQLLGFAD